MTELLPRQAQERQRVANFLHAAGYAGNLEDARDQANGLWRHDIHGHYFAALDGGDSLAHLQQHPEWVRYGVREVFRLLAWQSQGGGYAAVTEKKAAKEYLERTDLPHTAKVAADGLLAACQEYGAARYRATNVPGMATPAFEMVATIAGSTLEVDE